MSLNKEKILYCVPTMQDALRHTPKSLIGKLEFVTYGEGFSDFFKILNAILCKRMILLNGFRFCDRCIASVGLYLGSKVIILQHGRNEYFESGSLMLLMRKFIAAPRYFYELAFLLILNTWFYVIKIKKKRSINENFCKLFYFTESYKDLWIKYLNDFSNKLNLVKVRPPNAAEW